MSAVRQLASVNQPAARQVNLSSQLRLIVNRSRGNTRIASVVTVGVIGIILLGLLLNLLTAQGAYEMVNLKNQTKELTTTTQVLQEQVNSLSSNQNLEQAAHDMGMISNSNPVFLSIGAQKVYGKPKAAQVGSSLAGNLVSNSALDAKTNIKLLAAKKAASDAAKQAEAASKLKAQPLTINQVSNVAAAKLPTKKVSLPSSGIPGSPTH